MTKRPATDRIIHSALEVISDFGVRRFTVDELARRVGLSRVTIYRHFESKREVLEAALLHELNGFTTQVETAVAGYEDPERRVLEAFVFAVASLRRHAVLQRLLRTEPELILPLLSTQAGPVLEAGRELITRIARDRIDGEPLASPQLDVVAELMSRMILSLVLTPESVAPLATEEDLRAYATDYLGAIIGSALVSESAP